MGCKAVNIQKIKQHLFYEEHLLDRYVELGVPAIMQRFDSDLGIANTWKRLEQGQALVGFQGRGFIEMVHPDFCHSILL